MKPGVYMVRGLACMLAAALLNLAVGCIYYRPVEIPAEQPIMLDPEKEIIIHHGDRTWLLSAAEITASHLSGVLSPATRITSRSRGDQRKMEETHLYIGRSVPLEVSENGAVSIPITAVEKVEIYDVAIGKTLFAWVGGGVAIVGAIWLVILLTKESCPFIYAWNGEDYQFVGEIFSGAIHRPLERHDYLPMTGLEAVNGEYRIRITNEVKEIQHINLAELLIVDHSPRTGVLVDKHGATHTLGDLRPPLEALSLNTGQSLSQPLSERDGLAYTGEEAIPAEPLRDGAVLTFDRPAGTDIGKLVIRAKNSFWLDYIFGQFTDLFGDLKDEWEQQQESADRDRLLNWQREQGIPLAVYLDTEHGWEYVDHFNIMGPMAFRDDVLAVDLSRAKAGPVRIKLEYGFMFWELDYAAMDFSPAQPVAMNRIMIENGIAQDERDVKPLLAAADTAYYHLPAIGDQAILSFAAPGQARDIKRSIFLHASGYYRILRPSSGRPDIAYLETFRNPGAFNRFSNERLAKLLSRITD
ncbi:MAG: hypothetical protein JSW54_10765 [Fidelibacterota bacterium]|nr:MAG: hypothetical protein JSW54_10765 [Candidatus Neomarinimicrobiota bacterium]